MITILVLEASHPDAATATVTAAGDPSVEILSAADPEEALEKLARNRRIDAVLLLPGSPARELAETLAEEDPTAPPLFAPASMGEISGVRKLSAEETPRLIDAIVEFLEPR
jgi:DNA-binding NarL/FixJ family response regulator